MFIYDRTECEFSGIHTMYAMDLFTIKQIGVRLGFNETDALEYYMFKGAGDGAACRSGRGVLPLSAPRDRGAVESMIENRF